MGHKSGTSYPPWPSASVRSFVKGKTMGILLDLDNGELSFASNGKSFGPVNSKQPKINYKTGTWVLYIADGSSAGNHVDITVRKHPIYPVPKGYKVW